MVKLRPPNLATANVYGNRRAAPTSVGSAVSRNLPAASMPYSGPRNSTITDQMLQTEKPMCSEVTDQNRLRLATLSPPPFQNVVSSGRQSSIHRPCRPGLLTAAPGVRVPVVVLVSLTSELMGYSRVQEGRGTSVDLGVGAAVTRRGSYDRAGGQAVRASRTRSPASSTLTGQEPRPG